MIPEFFANTLACYEVGAVIGFVAFGLYFIATKRR